MNKAYQTPLFNVVVFASLFGLFSSQSYAQFHREFGVGIGKNQYFDFTYKDEYKTNKYLRFRLTNFTNTLFISGGAPNNLYSAIGAAIGLEKRVDVQHNFMFVHGWDFHSGISLSHNTLYRTDVSIGYLVGLQYNVSDKFYVNLNITPYLSYQYYENVNGTAIYLSTNLNYLPIHATIAYRMQKVKKVKK
ncbi:MAG: hypothetical protein GC181_12170 [Bacteroidetes bacterium]|nr:hypothetical protein [Bacteroidota bacterium]